MKVAINERHGGFGLSDKALRLLRDEYGWDVTGWDDGDYADPDAPIVDNRDDEMLSRFSDFSLTLTVYDGADWRADDDLIEVIERLGDEANGDHAKLKIVEIPDDVDWQIEEYDGAEWIAETHRTWS